MICVKLYDKTFGQLCEILDAGKVRMAEIVIDDCDLDEEQVGYLFGSFDIPLIANCRTWNTGRSRSDNAESASSPTVTERLQSAERLLEAAVEAGAAYIDIPVSVPPQIGKRLCRKAREEGTTVIRSFTDVAKTPPVEQLQGIIDKCRRFGAEIVRLSTRITSDEDWAALSGVFGNGIAPAPESHPIPIVLDTAGEALSAGTSSAAARLQALKLGAPFVFAEPGDDAAGLEKAIYGTRTPYERDGLRMPASKSFAQRAIIAAALAEGTSRLEGYSECEDNRSAIRAARSLGAEVTEERGSLTIKGIGPLTGKLALDEMFVGESGLLARMMIPLMAMIARTPVTVSGEKTLLGRPLKGAADIMAPFGVLLTPAGSKGSSPAGSKEPSPAAPKIPLTVSGGLIPGRAEISGAEGSQLITGLLMALPLAEKPSTLYVSEPKSIPYMFITLDVMRHFGVTISNEMEGDEQFVQTGDWALCTQIDFKVKAPQKYKAAQFTIESDWSAAANYLVAGALFGGVSIDGLAVDSLQADLAIMDILVEAGAVASHDEDGRINVRRAPLRAFTTDLSNSPDIFPIVAVLACFCPGQTRLKGVHRLRGKESDRAKAILDTLTQMGVEVGIEGDELLIEGHSLEQRILTDTLLKGGQYTTYHDHRMLMALRVAELGADSPIEVDDEECVAKSFPDFRL